MFPLSCDLVKYIQYSTNAAMNAHVNSESQNQMAFS